MSNRTNLLEIESKSHFWNDFCIQSNWKCFDEQQRTQNGNLSMNIKPYSHNAFGWPTQDRVFLTDLNGHCTLIFKLFLKTLFCIIIVVGRSSITSIYSMRSISSTLRAIGHSGVYDRIIFVCNFTCPT